MLFNYFRVRITIEEREITKQREEQRTVEGPFSKCYMWLQPQTSALTPKPCSQNVPYPLADLKQ